MLKQRVLTALVLAPVVLWALFFLSIDHFLIALNVVLLIGAWEWSALAGLKRLGVRLAYVGSHVAAIAGLHVFVGYQPSLELFVLPLLLWCFALWWVARYPSAGSWQQRNVRMLVGYLVLLPCWLAFVVVKTHPAANQMLLVLLLLVWGADVGAYFAGKRFGVTKLAAVSPGKTREGVYGGLFTCLLIALAGALWLGLSGVSMFYLVVLALFTGLISVLGDLFESMLKRHCGLKDSGNLLPGHGGVMDRIDSLTAAAPLFALGIQLMPLN